MGEFLRGTYSLDEIDQALFAHGIPAVSRPYVRSQDGDVVEMEFMCYHRGKKYDINLGVVMVFSAFWIEKTLDKVRYKLVLDGRRRLLTGVLSEYEVRDKYLD